MKHQLTSLLLAAAIAYYVTSRKKRQQERSYLTLVHSREQETPAEIARVEIKLAKGLDFFRTQGISGTVHGRHNIPVRYVKFQAEREKATVLFLTGWSESILKYGDFFQELCENGCTIIALDHRSQGLSGRPSRTLVEQYDSLKTHVEDFHDHLTDTLLVMNELGVSASKTRLFLMGFSLGGLVAAHTATMVKCAGLILLAPCLLPRTGYPPLVVRGITTALRLLGKGEQFVPGHPFGVDHRMLMPPSSRVSSSSTRIRFWERLRMEQSEVCINGMSVSHLDELMRARFTPACAERLLADRFLVVSAELDLYVENSAIFDFTDTISSRSPCRHVHMTGAKHEILSEREEIRSRVVDEVVSFVMY